MALLRDLPVNDYVDSFVSSLNPNPIIPEEADLLITEFLSPTKLQEITSEENLENVTSLEMEVDTSETSLGNFGMHLPNLRQLKLSNSIIPSVRDIGTSLGHVTVLWMSCCGINDVDGIASMMELEELYLSFNNISDISPLSFLDSLQVLDLEGNCIADLDQLDYLTILCKLKTLMLSGNPICNLTSKEMHYSDFIRSKLPNIQRLNDVDGSENRSLYDFHSTTDSVHSPEDIQVISQAIKDGIISEETVRSLSPSSSAPSPSHSAKETIRRPMSAKSLINNNSNSSLSDRVGSANSHKSETQANIPKSRPHSSESGEISLQDETSTLTFGDVICGNPIRALRMRKQVPLPVVSILNNTERSNNLKRPATAVPAYNRSMLSKQTSKRNEDNKNDVLEELVSWRQMHEKRMNEIKSNVQVLKIHDNSESDQSDSSNDDDVCLYSSDEKTTTENFDINSNEIDKINSDVKDFDTHTVKTISINKTLKTTVRSPVSHDYRKLIPVANSAASSSMAKVSSDTKLKYVPTPPKIGGARPRTATEFRSTYFRKARLSGDSNITPLSSIKLKHSTQDRNQQVVSPVHKIKSVHEIKNNVQQ